MKWAANSANWIMHHLSPTRMIGNMATHMVEIVRYSWGLIAALINHDMYTCGKNLAELIMTLIN